MPVFPRVRMSAGLGRAAAAPRAHYIEVAGEDHISLPMRLDLLAPTVIDWLDNADPARKFCPSPLALALALAQPRQARHA